MKRNTLLLLLALAPFCTMHGQDTLPERKAIVTVGVLSPTFSFAPRFTAGYMHKVARLWWVGVTGGYGAAWMHIGKGDYVANDYSLFEIRPELYFDLRPKSKLKHLASIELFYINHTDHFTNGKLTDASGDNYYHYDSADYKRVKMGFNINYTLIYNFTSRLVLLQKVGCGLRNRKVTYSNVVNKTSDYEDWEVLSISNSDFIQKTGSNWNANFNLEYNLAYKF